MKYTVKKIEEDLDFGCEERAEDAPLMAVVTLLNIEGQTEIRRFEDGKLMENDIQEGNTVFIDTDGILCKCVDC